MKAAIILGETNNPTSNAIKNGFMQTDFKAGGVLRHIALNMNYCPQNSFKSQINVHPVPPWGATGHQRRSADFQSAVSRVFNPLAGRLATRRRLQIGDTAGFGNPRCAIGIRAAWWLCEIAPATVFQQCYKLERRAPSRLEGDFPFKLAEAVLGIAESGKTLWTYNAEVTGLE
jgi:hypothetical protein